MTIKRYYKGKRTEKKCSKSACLCDGTSKDFFILVEAFYDDNGQNSKLLSVVSDKINRRVYLSIFRMGFRLNQNN
jgi:hypothetical protein